MATKIWDIGLIKNHAVAHLYTATGSKKYVTGLAKAKAATQKADAYYITKHTINETEKTKS